MSPDMSPRGASRSLKNSVGDLQLPPVIEEAGEEVRRKFLEFFTAQIASENTRKAYGRAAIQFFNWCEERGLSLEDVSPLRRKIFRSSVHWPVQGRSLSGS